MIQERIAALRSLMAERQIDAYMIPTSDFHESEYVGDYFKCRKFITGFTGSAGTAIITQTEARLWTDGRYFVQAAKQLEGTGVLLMKSGQEGVPTEEEYLAEVMPQNGTLGFDGRVVNSQLGEKLEELLEDKHVKFSWKEDLVDLIWEDRPALSAEPVWILKENYAGKSAADKIADLREAMKKEKTTVHVLTTLDDIVWLLNIRGNDVVCNPVVLSYALVTMERFYLFINEAVLDSEVKSYLKELGVTVRPYNDIYDAVSQLKGQKVLLETAKTNYAIISNLDESNAVIDRMNPTAPAKAVKNPVEIENMKKAHIKDGVAMAKFICWLKKNIGKQTITELDAEHYLDNLRAEQEGNLGLSFHTISAYGANAAMCHYHSSEASNKPIGHDHFYLNDSGGQYVNGTTDATRTLAWGKVAPQQRLHYTAVLRGFLSLITLQFPSGTQGHQLDAFARRPLWEMGLDYDHGTGHGVGHQLLIHENPHRIAKKVNPWPLVAGNIMTIEPGYYLGDSHGIRIENQVEIVESRPGFCKFSSLTLIPIDLSQVELHLLSEQEKQWLDEYHQQVRETLSPLVESDARPWLVEATAPIRV